MSMFTMLPILIILATLLTLAISMILAWINPIKSKSEEKTWPYIQKFSSVQLPDRVKGGLILLGAKKDTDLYIYDISDLESFGGDVDLLKSVTMILTRRNVVKMLPYRKPDEYFWVRLSTVQNIPVIVYNKLDLMGIAVSLQRITLLEMLPSIVYEAKDLNDALDRVDMWLGVKPIKERVYHVS